ncbi:MAG TPA: hypothetical protein VMH20_00810 [Verrucomicrobiae bacterium]|jgi:hypothetical protein|nr:hypothetical protein [Verrucomicrobiae bacterium]
MKREGTLTIVYLNHGRPGEPKYNVGFSDYASREVATTQREIVTENELKKYLTEQVKVHLDSVDVVLRQLKAAGSAAIFHLILTDEELKATGLR